jgi:hypothetical protein
VDQWYYTHAATIRGPVSARELRRLAQTNGLHTTDLIWPAGADQSRAVPAAAALSFPSQPVEEAAGSALPPTALGKPTTPPALTPAVEVPGLDWLADVEQGDAMLQSTIPVVVDWLEDIQQIEQSLQGRPPKHLAAPASNVPIAMPVVATAALPEIPVASPVFAAPATPALAPPSVPAEPLGHDPETGQILDPAAYARWQKADALRRQKEIQQTPTISIAEVYLEAQHAVQAWVDAAANQALVADGNADALRNCPSVQELMRRYEAYGPVMRAKLWQRLFFLVDNRKKYYQASR